MTLIETKDQNRTYIEDLKALGVDADRLWISFKDHRKRCRKKTDRNGDQVLFLLTFKEWSEMWLQTDDLGEPYWNNRGSQNASDYVMSRKEDTGHYELGNVFIQTNSENAVEANSWKWEGQENRKKQSEAMKKAFKEADDDKKDRMLRGTKALSKPVSYNGVVYASASECARAVGLTQPTISIHAKNPNNINVFYI
jgi:hypothetical protein